MRTFLTFLSVLTLLSTIGFASAQEVPGELVYISGSIDERNVVSVIDAESLEFVYSNDFVLPMVDVLPMGEGYLFVNRQEDGLFELSFHLEVGDHLLTVDTDVASYNVSRDGSALAYDKLSDDGSMYITYMEQSQEFTIPGRSPKLSEDGEHMLYVRNDSDMEYLMHRDVDAEEDVWIDSASRIPFYGFAGEYAAYVERYGIYFYDPSIRTTLAGGPLLPRENSIQEIGYCLDSVVFTLANGNIYQGFREVQELTQLTFGSGEEFLPTCGNGDDEVYFVAARLDEPGYQVWRLEETGATQISASFDQIYSLVVR